MGFDDSCSCDMFASEANEFAAKFLALLYAATKLLVTEASTAKFRIIG